jgi:hypothetical protein
MFSPRVNLPLTEVSIAARTGLPFHHLRPPVNSRLSVESTIRSVAVGVELPARSSKPWVSCPITAPMPP